MGLLKRLQKFLGVSGGAAHQFYDTRTKYSKSTNIDMRISYIAIAMSLNIVS